MLKTTFMGAGSTVFVRNVIGDCMCTPALRDAQIALYDIDAERLKDSEIILNALNRNIDDIVKMCDELIEAHGDFMNMYK